MHQVLLKKLIQQINIKSDVDKLDIDRLKNVSSGLDIG